MVRAIVRKQEEREKSNVDQCVTHDNHYSEECRKASDACEDGFYFVKEINVHLTVLTLT
jgi:hypothetical protein